VLLPKQHKKDPNCFRKFRRYQKNENRLLFEVEKQPEPIDFSANEEKVMKSARRD